MVAELTGSGAGEDGLKRSGDLLPFETEPT